MRPALLLTPLAAALPPNPPADALAAAPPPNPPGDALAAAPPPASALAARSGCNQSLCPDSRFGVDLWSAWAHNFAWLTELRWRGVCGCHAFAVDTRVPCRTFSICSGTHSVCLDWRAGRGHWVDPQGRKTCYRLVSAFVCGKKGWQSWPSDEVECTW